MFTLDKIYLYIILYRLIVVILFSLSAQSIYLIIFGDYYKEILLYNYLFNQLKFKLDYGIMIIIILKTLFEYYWHSIKNPISYQ